MGGTFHKTILLLPLSPIWESFLLPSLTDVRVISTYYNLQRAPSHKPSHWGMMNHPKLGPLGWNMWIFANFIVKLFCWLPTLASTSPCHCNAAEVECGNTSCTWDFFCKNYIFSVVAQKLIMQQCNVSIFWLLFLKPAEEMLGREVTWWPWTLALYVVNITAFKVNFASANVNTHYCDKFVCLCYCVGKSCANVKSHV